MDITSADQLCYEVWVEYTNHTNMLVGSYWNVMDAWRVMKSITQVEKPDNVYEAKVLVANGMSIWVPTGEVSKRKDVIS